MAKKTNITCLICKEIYDDPIIIHCGHTFCRRCAEYLNQQARTFKGKVMYRTECYLCQTPLSDEEARDTFIPNENVRIFCEDYLSYSNKVDISSDVSSRHASKMSKSSDQSLNDLRALKEIANKLIDVVKWTIDELEEDIHKEIFRNTERQTSAQSSADLLNIRQISAKNHCQFRQRIKNADMVFSGAFTDLYNYIYKKK
uniref:RING-type domain-containing protein n=1 Tax=Steinernema glaseri TaxID=37863 RepID=A0A1I7Z4B8_9BILA